MGKLRAGTALKKEGIDLPDVLQQIGKKQWSVYAKAPFGGPAQVVEYLGRYIHPVTILELLILSKVIMDCNGASKIAITKHRVLEVTDSQVRFRYKDYADGNKTKEMLMGRQEFLRRFEQHILPKGFVKIRHYGYLQNRNKHQRLNEIRLGMKLEPLKPSIKTPVEIRMLMKYGKDIFKCPCCEKGRLVLVQIHYCSPGKRGSINNKASPVEN